MHYVVLLDRIGEQTDADGVGGEDETPVFTFHIRRNASREYQRHLRPRQRACVRLCVQRAQTALG